MTLDFQTFVDLVQAAADAVTVVTAMVAAVRATTALARRLRKRRARAVRKARSRKSRMRKGNRHIRDYSLPRERTSQFRKSRNRQTTCPAHWRRADTPAAPKGRRAFPLKERNAL